MADFPIRVREHRPGPTGKPPKLFAVTKPLTGNVTLNLCGLVNRPDDGTDAPFWLDGSAGRPPAGEVISAPNGLFLLEDLAAGRGPFSPPTPHLFTPNALSFAVDQDPPRPATWMRCLGEWFDGDRASIDGLQEWLGYLLTADTRAQKILMLVGPRRSGKGTILHILNELVGPANVASTTFAGLGENFGLESLLGKRVATIPDARLSGRSDIGAIVERLLSVSGEDAQSVNRKGRARITARLKIRLVLATNEIPRLPDAAGALASRFHILRTPNSWYGREDESLKDKLAVELPGILRWAAEGWVRLKANRMRFTQSAVAESYRQELADLSSPISAFVRQCCHVGPTHEADVQELYKAWHVWNQQQNREIGSAMMFGRDLRSALSHVEVSQRRTELGDRKRFYRGVGLKPSDEWNEPEDGPARNDTRSDLTHTYREEHENSSHKDTITPPYTHFDRVSSDRVPSRASDLDEPDPHHARNGADLHPPRTPPDGPTTFRTFTGEQFEEGEL